ncbi:transglycosylase SLT domain-containing protein [Polycladidibacter hongkongensis]|uniref:transglycosylase SLT domain-containing protein n=1 Tax=Polycladidibacter hongkongensis TaxID=1647556 RepID=UPI00082FD1DA|nr:transglycosylase SLT domain-containing protein [Pseudovibrio hongkongensis]
MPSRPIKAGALLAAQVFAVLCFASTSAHALSAQRFGYTSSKPLPKPAGYGAPTMSDGGIAVPFPRQKPQAQHLGTAAAQQLAYAPPTRSRYSTLPTARTTNEMRAQAHRLFAKGLERQQVHTGKSNLSRLIKFIDEGKTAEALQQRRTISRGLDKRLADWLLVTYGGPQIPPAYISQFAATAGNWPSVKTFRAKAEQSLAAAKLTPTQVIGAFGQSTPEAAAGKLALARAYLTIGNTSEATKLITNVWQSDALTNEQEAEALKDLARLIPAQLHWLRAQTHVMEGRYTRASKLASYLTSEQQRLLSAAITRLRGQKGGASKLAALSKSSRDEPLYIYAMVKAARASGDYDLAGRWLAALSASAEAATDPAEWWIQRRVVSRHLAETGHGAAAYKVAAAHQSQKPSDIAEAEFHAGWFALRAMNDPRRALPHFKKLEKIAKKPVSSARAQYWQARSHEALGNTTAAIQHYSAATTFPATYYGQLAMAKLGESRLPLEPAYSFTDIEAQSFNQNELVMAIYRLKAIGEHDKAVRLYAHLASNLAHKGELRLLTHLATYMGKPAWSVMAGKRATTQHPQLSGVSFPLETLPPRAIKTPPIELPVIYAISRKESAFDPKAKSHAGALGLMQLMPATAKRTAKSLSLRYSKSRLTSDPAYNATLGGNLLAQLTREFNGSYILAFVAYNAGKSKAYEWIDRFGDPRDPKIDPIDWVEKIPYGETRNYVQRVLEAVQVYRSKMGKTQLAIISDLTRG